jgi:hypothetical protein
MNLSIHPLLCGTVEPNIGGDFDAQIDVRPSRFTDAELLELAQDYAYRVVGCSSFWREWEVSSSRSFAFSKASRPVMRGCQRTL